MILETVIGLEVHVQLKTQSKLFSGASTAFGAQPNSQVCFIDAGFPGVLPVLNQKVVHMAIQFGLAIKGKIHKQSYFERKNYFYPDLPKGYQISQFQHPIITDGHLMIQLANGLEKKIPIMRAHLEEDAGKSHHDLHLNYTAIDLNRAGNPLLEIVTPPCFSSAEEAVEYLKTLHQLVRFMEICDGNMQEGSFRCDVNLSVRPKDSPILGVRTEIKNLNSFRFVEKAIVYEEKRHRNALQSGEQLYQETRLYSPEKQRTEILRRKEGESDYRYFPDPDLLPLIISEKDIQVLAKSLPTLPDQIKKALRNNPALDKEDISFILSDPGTYHHFNAVKKGCIADEKTIINWFKGPYAKWLNQKNLSFAESPVCVEEVSLLLDCLAKGEITYQIAKQAFEKYWEKLEGADSHSKENISIETILREEKNANVYDKALLEPIIEALLTKYPQQVAEYREGKEKLISFFIGLVMKETKGNTNPEMLRAVLSKKLNKV